VNPRTIHSFWLEGFLAPGQHARVVNAALGLAGSNAIARDLRQGPHLAIEIEHRDLILRVTGRQGVSDRCDTDLVMSALNEAASQFDIPFRFAFLSNAVAQDAELAVVALDELIELRRDPLFACHLPRFGEHRFLMRPRGSRVYDGDVTIDGAASAGRLAEWDVVAGDFGLIDVVEELHGAEHLVSVGRLSLVTSSVGDLRGMRGLRFVGDLLIHRCERLETLDGLDNLERVLGTIDIANNPVLRDVSALGRVREVGVDVRFADNALLPRPALTPVRRPHPALILDTRELRVEEPVAIGGVRFRDAIRYGLDGRVAVGTLAEDTRVGPCVARAGSVADFDNAGPGEMFTLAQPCRLGGVDLPAGVGVSFWEGLDQPSSATLSGPVDLLGRRFVGGCSLLFSEQGELLCATLPDDTTIDWDGEQWQTGGGLD
jgi:hypothetical protein